MEEDIDIIKTSIDMIHEGAVDSWCHFDNLIIGKGSGDCENCIFYFPVNAIDSCIMHPQATRRVI